MGILELIIVGAGVSMDAFAVSICKGLATPRMTLKPQIVCGLYFGIFQGVMIIAGILAASAFSQMITAFDHWIAFVLLMIIGANMIREGFMEERPQKSSLAPSEMIPLAIATSIDALAVGVTLYFMDTDILAASLIIDGITFVFGFFGVKIGNVFGTKYRKKAEIVGGIVLMLMAVRILLSHLGIIGF